jgi:uncharacterized alpha-E superfamily protein
MSETLPHTSYYLLSRYAEALFWLGRYMERIENTARILDVTESFVRSGGTESGWLSVLQINADTKRFLEHHKEVTQNDVVQFYVLDRENPTSIATAMAQAHENARTLRPLISTEMWTQLNLFHKEVRALTSFDVAPSRLSRLCDMLKQRCQLHAGITDGTFFRDQSWHFYAMGRYMERADQTTRLVDIKYHTLLPSVQDVGGAIDVSQWNSLLRAAAAYHAFRRIYPSGMTPTAVAGFLLMNHSFPRSLVLCTEQMRQHLAQLRAGYGLRAPDAAELTDELRAALISRSIDQVLGQGLHEFLDWVQLQLIRTHEAISHAFWRAPPTAELETQSQTQSQG